MRKLLLATTVALSTGLMLAPTAEAGPYGRGGGWGGGHHHHGGYGGGYGRYGGGYGRRGIGTGAAVGLGIAGLAAGAIAAGAARDAYNRNGYYAPLAYGPRYRAYDPYYDGY